MVDEKKRAKKDLLEVWRQAAEIVGTQPQAPCN
jgi:hypothetical protein